MQSFKNFITEIRQASFIDNVNGLGSVPYNQEVKYKGIEVMMKPSTFLDLAESFTPKSGTVEYLVSHLKSGGKIGTPFLQINRPTDESETVAIRGHEGRHRMLALKELYGDKPVPVQILVRGGNRKHLSDATIEGMSKAMVKQSSSTVIRGNLFKY